MNDQEKFCETAEAVGFIRVQLEQLENKLLKECNEAPVEPPTVRIGPPLEDVRVLSPGTHGVLQWPVDIDLDITAKIVGRDISISCPDKLGDWPTVMRDLSNAGRIPYMGVTGWIYRSHDRGWVAYPAEYARPGKEATGTFWDWEDKFVQAAAGMPDPDTPIGIFVAGMWRHAPDKPEYHRRTEVKWFTWPELVRVDDE